MTAGEMLASAAFRYQAIRRSKWTPVLAVAALALVLVCKLDNGRRAEAEARRVAEAEVLRQKGVAVAAQRDAAGMRKALAVVVAQNEDLAAELARVKAAAPGAKPVAVIRGSTGPATAGGAPRPLLADPCRGPVEPGPAGGPPACLLAAGDVGEIRVDEVLLRTKAGNIVFAGAASAWRLEPGPATRLFGGPLRAELAVEKPAGAPGWGWGAAGALGRDGWAVGVAVSPPPRRMWGWQGEVVLSGTAGPTGEWGGHASALVRRAR